MKTCLRLLLAVLFCSCGAALAFFAVGSHAPLRKPFRLALDRPLPPHFNPPASGAPAVAPDGVVVPTITFGHPIMSGIQGNGFEVDLRMDPSNLNRIYESAPGALSSDTSWIWRSLDAGRTFKWVPAATTLTGKAMAACAGGGDTELGVDIAGRIYFCDLTLANFSTGRSDDLGATFQCTNSGVPDAVVDRQWYAFDGDPLNGGSIYLTNDEFAQGP